MDELHFELLENGLDFISSGLTYIARGETKSDLKYGVLHLSSGIDLVLKERLRQEDWTLVFKKLRSADEFLYQAGNFRSVDQRECLQRLEDYCGIEISQKQKDRLNAFRSPRNRLEHFAIIDTKAAIESLAAQALGVLLDFIAEHFESSSLSKRDTQLLLQVREQLSEFEAFTKRRLSDLLAERKDDSLLVQCPSCLQSTLHADVDVECKFCGYQATGSDAAYFYIAQHDLTRNIYYCPECVNKTLVDLGSTGGSTPATQFVCFGCGLQWVEGQLEICEKCQEAVAPEYMTPVGCPNCFDAYVAGEHS
jgi:hypothetical protein